MGHAPKMVRVVVTGITYKKPSIGELLEVKPVTSIASNYWHQEHEPCRIMSHVTDTLRCPICGMSGIRDTNQLWIHIDVAGQCPGRVVGVKVRLDNGATAFISKKKL